MPSAGAHHAYGATPEISSQDVEAMSPAAFWERVPERLQTHFTKRIMEARKAKAQSLSLPLTVEEKQFAMTSLFIMSQPRDTPEEVLLHLAEGDRYFKEHNNPINGVPLPPRDLPLLSKEFDNIKIFYHADIQPISANGSFTFYIARPGFSSGQCIDWRAEGIRITTLAYSGKWVECILPRLPGNTVFRVQYPDPEQPGRVRTQDCRLPVGEPPEGPEWEDFPVFPTPFIRSANILQL